MKRASVLIAGCGDVGTRLGLLLAGDGNRVFGLRRNPGALPPAITPLAGDLADPSTLGSLPGDCQLVIYAAAADGRDEAAYRRAYVEGPANVLQALRARDAPVTRVVFVSSTGVYAQHRGEWVDEDTVAEPAGFTGRMLKAGEALVTERASSSVVVRFGGIYGPGRDRLLRLVRAGEACVEDPPKFTNRIHAQDCARVLAHVAALPDPASIYLGVDCAPAPECEVMDWIAARLAVPAPPRREGDEGPRGKRCSNRRLLASGFRFLYPGYADGYAAVIDGG